LWIGGVVGVLLLGSLGLVTHEVITQTKPAASSQAQVFTEPEEQPAPRNNHPPFRELT